MGDSMKLRSWLLLTSALSLPAFGAESLYVARSKDQGTPFDLVLSEVKREASTSILSVPAIHKRTAAGSRWLMCMYNDLAVKRGFRYWTVVYPEESSETFPIAFYHDPNEDLAKLLGADYVRERAFPPAPTPVEKWHKTICNQIK